MEKINLDYLLGNNTDLLFNGKGKVLCSKQAIINYFNENMSIKKLGQDIKNDKYGNYIDLQDAYDKINEIIDWVNEPDEGYDSLKTLEDKIEFIMKNTLSTTKIPNNDNWDSSHRVPARLQDLWDEQNEDKGWSCGKCKQEALGLTNEPIPEHHRTCRNRIEPTVKECENGEQRCCVIYDKAEKIEEIISGIWDVIAEDWDTDKDKVESWLRDKLKEFIR